MHHFFVEPTQICGDTIAIEGSDLNHMKNVLRIKPGESVEISDGSSNRYICEVDEYEQDSARLHICDKIQDDVELPSRIYLFQGLPKACLLYTSPSPRDA